MTHRRPEDPFATLGEARSVGLVGVSEKSFFGRLFVKNLVDGGFGGDIVPVHHAGGVIGGYRVFPSIEEIDQVDAGVLLLRADRCAKAARDLADRGCRSLLVMADGFAETGTEAGRHRQQELLEVCQDRGMALFGPNGVGAAVYHAGVSILGVPVPSDVAAGDTSVFSQSGAVLAGLVEGLAAEGVGLDVAMSVGNGAQLGVVDVIEVLAGRPTTRFIVGYVEGFGDLVKTRLALCRARDAGKTVILVKTGKSDLASAVAASHTATLAGADEVVTAMLDACGVHRVDEPEELTRTVAIASRLPGDTAGGGLAVVTASGGNAGILADLATASRVRLADFEPSTWAQLRERVPESGFVGNPLDVTGQGAAGGLDLEAIYETVFADPNVAVVLYGFGPPMPDDSPERKAHRGAFELLAHLGARYGKPLLIPTTSLQRITDWTLRFASGHPHVLVCNGHHLTLKALAHLLPAPAAGTLEVADEHDSPSTTHVVLSESRGRALLASAGLAVVPGVDIAAAGTRGELRAAVGAAAQLLGPPYVLKATIEGLSHKADVGAVAVGLLDATSLVDAADEMSRAVGRHRPDLRIDGFMVQEMVRGIELLVGLVRHDGIGPTMTFGLGGQLSEVTDHHATVALDGAGEGWVERIIDRAGLGPLLRAQPEAARAGLSEWLLRAADAFTAGGLRTLHTVEVNPLFLLRTGPVAADALVVADDATRLASTTATSGAPDPR